MQQRSKNASALELTPKVDLDGSSSQRVRRPSDTVKETRHLPRWCRAGSCHNRPVGGSGQPIWKDRPDVSKGPMVFGLAKRSMDGDQPVARHDAGQGNGNNRVALPPLSETATRVSARVVSRHSERKRMPARSADINLSSRWQNGRPLSGLPLRPALRLAAGQRRTVPWARFPLGSRGMSVGDRIPGCAVVSAGYVRGHCRPRFPVRDT